MFGQKTAAKKATAAGGDTPAGSTRKGAVALPRSLNLSGRPSAAPQQQQFSSPVYDTMQPAPAPARAPAPATDDDTQVPPPSRLDEEEEDAEEYDADADADAEACSLAVASIDFGDDEDDPKEGVQHVAEDEADQGADQGRQAQPPSPQQSAPKQQPLPPQGLQGQQQQQQQQDDEDPVYKDGEFPSTSSSSAVHKVKSALSSDVNGGGTVLSFNRDVEPSDRSVRVREMLFARNRAWAEKIKRTNPHYFSHNARLQVPKYLWIGCSDSRVPANVLMGLAPGEVFVHRNIANVITHTDFNCLSVIQYAVEVLKVEYIIVCGHYGCGGVRAALGHNKFGLIDNWLRHIKDSYARYEGEFVNLSEDDALDRLAEINVLQSVQNVVSTTIVQAAWERGQVLSVHGWIYALSDGLLHELADAKDVSSAQQLHPIYRMGQLSSPLGHKTSAAAAAPPTPSPFTPQPSYFVNPFPPTPAPLLTPSSAAANLFHFPLPSDRLPAATAGTAAASIDDVKRTYQRKSSTSSIGAEAALSAGTCTCTRCGNSHQPDK